MTARPFAGYGGRPLRCASVVIQTAHGTPAVKSEQVVSLARRLQVQVTTMAGEKTEKGAGEEDQVEVPGKAREAIAASGAHNALTLTQMMGSFGARTNLIRKQVRRRSVLNSF